MKLTILSERCRAYYIVKLLQKYYQWCELVLKSWGEGIYLHHNILSKNCTYSIYNNKNQSQF